MIVVPVLMTSCQVSEYLKNGPVISQMIMEVQASTKAQELPVHAVTRRDIFSSTVADFIAKNTSSTIDVDTYFSIEPGDNLPVSV